MKVLLIFKSGAKSVIQTTKPPAMFRDAFGVERLEWENVAEDAQTLTFIRLDDLSAIIVEPFMVQGGFTAL